MHAENTSRNPFGLAFLALIGGASVCVAQDPPNVFAMPLIPVNAPSTTAATTPAQTPIPVYSTNPNMQSANPNIFYTNPRMNVFRPNHLTEAQSVPHWHPIKKVEAFLRPIPKTQIQRLYWFHYIRGEGPAIWIHD